jgi:GGDEF domain-containing protein
MSIDPHYSHDGIRDDLTHCTAPPLFYAHVDRMIAGSMRTSSPFSLVALTLSQKTTPQDLIALAHSIAISMRGEDLCGRLGRFQFIIALTGDLSAAGELTKRVRESFTSGFSNHLVQWRVNAVQWRVNESSLELFFRLDVLTESEM